MSNVTINEQEAMTLFSWLDVKVFEVDITEQDIDLLRKIAPLLPIERYQHSIERIERMYEDLNKWI